MSSRRSPQSLVGLRDEVNEQELIERIGLDEDEIEWRKEFVGFDERDRNRLAELTPLFDSVADDFATTFYDHLQSFDESRAILAQSSHSLEELEATQSEYLRSLGDYAYDEGADSGYGTDYFRQRAVIGTLHSMLGMPAKQYIGSYARYHERLLTELFERFVADLEDDLDDDAHELVSTRATETLEDALATMRLTNLDLQVAMDTYHQSESRSVWINALNEMINPVLVIDGNGDVVVYNEAMAELTGVPEARAKELELWELFRTDETHGTRETVIERVLETEEPIRELDLEVLNHRDETLDVVLSNAPMYDDTGNLMGAVSVIRDVTELREKERALAETRARVTNEVGSLATQQEATAREITETMADLESRATEQAAMAEEMRDELQEYSASVEEVAASAEEVTSAAEQSKQTAEEGLEASTEAKGAVEDVVETADELLETATSLHDRMDEIDEIVDVISEVADQTNILALNANIEAAHAGDAGDGFAVVADEVQSLASETKAHTKEITRRIEDAQKQTDRTVDAARETNEIVDTASDDIDDALESLADIASTVDEAATGVEEIAAANDEQVDSVDEMVSMADGYADHSEAALEAAEATAELVDEQLRMAHRIREQIESFGDESAD